MLAIPLNKMIHTALELCTILLQHNPAVFIWPGRFKECTNSCYYEKNQIPDKVSLEIESTQKKKRKFIFHTVQITVEGVS